ncbi:hypothetical protein NEOLI_004501 [Neolecta irregularis DAH-3]|uniref:Uncharacterized protein n=1 Tax=Neolecta irregularis (strain DAH-3) TaxID=1198029 RepID=A0A1U7LGR8_NEOID|nr:hypothetical protein NEOLI_004501 [Neolecta irregularis DAH-3]|eukprot:OLL21839.1 hypothetical protein NEOLI_004501 [Neolecta irregularis DAH-3]
MALSSNAQLIFGLPIQISATKTALQTYKHSKLTIATLQILRRRKSNPFSEMPQDLFALILQWIFRVNRRYVEKGKLKAVEEDDLQVHYQYSQILHREFGLIIKTSRGDMTQPIIWYLSLPTLSIDARHMVVDEPGILDADREAKDAAQLTHIPFPSLSDLQNREYLIDRAVQLLELKVAMVPNAMTLTARNLLAEYCAGKLSESEYRQYMTHYRPGLWLIHEFLTA